MSQNSEEMNNENSPSGLKLSLGQHPIISRLTDFHDEFLHSHDFFEIIIIRYGTISHCVNEITYNMEVGDVCIVAPDTQHTFIRKGECAHRDVMISETLFKRTCDFLDIDLDDKLQTEGFLNFHISAKQINDFEDLYCTLIESDDENVQKVSTKTISCHLISLLHNNTQPVSPSDPFKSKCITIINENYKDKNIVNILLTELGYTQGHFCKKFKSAFQLTPVEYINRRRIIAAASTLVLSNYSVEHCCHSVGFDSLPHFIKLFKAHYGITPTKYRRTYRISKHNPK